MTVDMSGAPPDEGLRARRKRESLTRILDAGAARLRVDGPDGGAIGTVMRDAGLTHGAFYAHFASKDELAIAAFRHALAGSRPRWIGTKADASWGARAARLARGYLNRPHRDDRADSCAFSAVGSDAARMPADFRAVYEQELRKSLNAMGGRPVDATQEHELYDEAIATLALCIGGLVLSRAVESESFSSRILRVCRNAAARMGAAVDEPNEGGEGDKA
ncbi:TetR/AcrR family transcriptional regulator [Nocardia sp. CNY236]|uniref:TetR/AcrR family transcriptional regulator n=1 Tax=Nocardia sp. CNY236 TaxID=1169152 RepID=UPI000405F60B|nr:TetR/AcrR family transcriptional regulator [Nocardia sp. CNY236]